MPVTKEQVLSTAALVRLNLTQGLAPDEAEQVLNRMASQMDTIVAYMDVLNQVDTCSVEPLYSPMSHTAPPREDVAATTSRQGGILANAPARQGTFFVVPPVL